MMGWWGLGLRCYHPGWLKSFCVVTSLRQELLIWQVFGRKMETTKNKHVFLNKVWQVQFEHVSCSMLFRYGINWITSFDLFWGNQTWYKCLWPFWEILFNKMVHEVIMKFGLVSCNHPKKCIPKWTFDEISALKWMTRSVFLSLIKRSYLNQLMVNWWFGLLVVWIPGMDSPYERRNGN